MSRFIPATLFVIFAAITLLHKTSVHAQANGKQLFESACSQCHSLAVPQAERLTKDEWKAIVSRMRSNGCDITNDQAAAIVEFLSQGYGMTK